MLLNEIDGDNIDIRFPDPTKREYKQLRQSQASRISQMTRALIEQVLSERKSKNA